jgi:hypothetical protein
VASAQPPPPPPPSLAAQARQGTAQAGRQQAVRLAGGGGGTGPSGGAHRLVLAEYLAVMLILFATEILGPIGAGKTTPTAEQAAKASAGAGILVRMTAASILFFGLALMANGPRAGRIAAAFGGLVVAGTALNAAPVWTGLARVFTGAAASGQPAPAAGEGGGGSVTAGEGGSAAGEGSGGKL